MPSLSDALATLSEQSAAIHLFSEHNLAPAGRFTTALLDSLRVNPDPRSIKRLASRRDPQQEDGLFGLIRDASDAEGRLFSFIGEVESAGTGRIKMAEGREGVVTPLKGGKVTGKGRRGSTSDGAKSKDDAEVLLKTALRLVDDYHQMPRARATIQKLLSTNNDQLERAFELELAIEEASSKNVEAGPSSVPIAAAAADPTATSTRPAPTSIDEAIRLEELALRKLDARLASQRSTSVRAQNSAAPPPSRGGVANSPDAGSRTPARPAAAASHTTPSSQPPINQARTPGQAAKTPSKSNINITNSLVSQTPRGPRATTFDRFSPLKFLGTPRNRPSRGASSGLREFQGAEREGTENSRVGQGIFGSRSSRLGSSTGGSAGQEMDETDATPAPTRTAAPEQLAAGDEEEEGEEEAGAEETVRLARVLSGPKEGESTQHGPEQSAPVQAEDPVTVTRQQGQGQMESAGRVEGVYLAHPAVSLATAKISETLSDVMVQGVWPDRPVGADAESIVSHIARLARSDPDPPPSPSSHSTSTLSSAAPAPRAAPITQQSILAAHILLAMLRSAPTSTDPSSAPADTLVELGMSINDMKEMLATLARVRGWEADDKAAEALGTRSIYHLVGKKVVKIDRRATGAGGARLGFTA